MAKVKFETELRIQLDLNAVEAGLLRDILKAHPETLEDAEDESSYSTKFRETVIEEIDKAITG